MVLFLTRILGRYCTYFACTYFARWSVLERDVIGCVVISVLSFHVVLYVNRIWKKGNRLCDKYILNFIFLGVL